MTNRVLDSRKQEVQPFAAMYLQFCQQAVAFFGTEFDETEGFLIMIPVFALMKGPDVTCSGIGWNHTMGMRFAMLYGR